MRMSCILGKESAFNLSSLGLTEFLTLCRVFVEYNGTFGRNRKNQIWGQFTFIQQAFVKHLLCILGKA